jgi:hypothetical protein
VKRRSITKLESKFELNVQNATGPEQVFASVLEQGDQIEPACKMHLKRTMLQREPAVELTCIDPDRFGELRQLGLINEQI